MVETTTSKNKDRRHLSVRKCKILFSCISSILIPLLLTSFTVVLLLQQNLIAKTKRNIDLKIAADQNRQNRQAALDAQQQTQYVAYIRELAELFLTHRFPLDQHLLSIVVRPKTLSILDQLDSVRKSNILRFLHESQLISQRSESFLNLNAADFNNIRIGKKNIEFDMSQTSFSGIHFENASFSYLLLNGSDFSRARLCRTSFEQIHCGFCNFYAANLEEVRFDRVSLFKADLTKANLRNANISQDQVSRNRVDFSTNRFVFVQIYQIGSVSGATMPNGRPGRNPNLFSLNACRILTKQSEYRQTFNLSTYRHWINELRRKISLSYFISGWFSERDHLSFNITDFNDQGNILRRICKRTNQSNTSLHDHQKCIVEKWSLPSESFGFYFDRNRSIVEKFRSYDGTSIVSIEFYLQTNTSCRDLYFSIETD